MTRSPFSTPAAGFRRWLLPVVATLLLLGLTSSPTAQASGGVVSDDFSSESLSGVWSVVDPVGDGSVSLAGQGSSDAVVELAVGGGVSHDAWDANRSLRLMQQVDDVDGAVEVKFDSIPSTKFQGQGVLFEQDAENWLRFDVYSDGSGLYAFAASTIDGSSTKVLSRRITASDSVGLQVLRQGPDWELRTASDGGAWMSAGTFQRELAVSAVGPFASNHGSSTSTPAWTSLVDYVFDTAAPVEPEDGSAGPPPGPVDETAPVVSGVQVVPSAGGAVVSWSTDEPSTGVVDFGVSAAYGDQVPSVGTSSSHSVTLSGLAASTGYHFRITATDAAGNAGQTPDATFTTTAEAEEPPVDEGSPSLVSDDFSGSVLGSGWAVVDPVGDGSVSLVGQGTADARLSLALPAGSSHDPWHVDRSLRVLQPVADGDLGVEVKFDSVPSQKYQGQGLLFVQDAQNWVRFDVYSDGRRLYAFAASTTGGSSVKRLSSVVLASSSVRLVVTRQASTWQLQFGADGGGLSTVGAFSHQIAVSQAGPFASNHGSSTSTPAWTSLVDYVFDTAAPVEPEDGSAGPPPGPVDETAPVVSGVQVVPSAGGAVVSWSTDEPSTGVVDFGVSAAYGDQVPSVGTSSSHSVTLSGLAASTGYHFRITATDAAGNAGQTPDATFTTTAQNGGPSLDLWYGDTLTVGQHGQQQDWLNVLGRATDPDGVAFMSYRLNGGAERDLTLGPDNRRLQEQGDFNADIPWANLLVGDNQVRLTAVDALGAASSRTVTVTRVAGQPQEVPADITWDPTTSVDVQALPVDGRWTIDTGGARSIDPGYDRVLAVGDIGWTNYEMTVPITPLTQGPKAFSDLSGAPLLGVGVGWTGHEIVDSKQPAWGFYGTGAYAWARWHESGTQLELVGAGGNPKSTQAIGFPYGTTQTLKVRVETLPSGAVRYSVKLWPTSTPEPPGWNRTIDEDSGPASGSIALISHHLDARFGTVTVRNLS